ncbi:MAG: hypothetical protein M3P18_20845, partial [Actinomycetota bacterium]|nr:hypothetical protein [Actinomycetota bacterium]
MAEGARSEAAEAATITLSQLLARILDQLSLSAWLPSAALTLLMSFTLRLASHVEGAHSATSPGEALTRTLNDIGNTSFGALALMIVVIVVTTMLTQAFSFEAIRVMEGYWGTNKRVDRFAAWRCKRHRENSQELRTAYNRLRAAVWSDVAEAIEAEGKALDSKGEQRRFTDDMTALLEQLLVGTYTEAEITTEQQEVLDGYDWEAATSADQLRLLRSIRDRLRDYPTKPQHVMATRLGNVLRRYEDATGVADVETLVEKNYDSLPFSMQLSHDQQRARLDLYCSMIFVVWVTAGVAVLRFGYGHWPYGLAAVALSVVGAWVTYRASI